MVENMKPIIRDFHTSEKSVVSTIRTIILFGKNVSTYKFALASTLLKLKPQNEILFEDLRDNFIRELLTHYQKNPNQYQAGENSVTRAFDKYLINGNWEELLKIAEKNIYNNVFEAFHNVGGGTIKKEFILFEHLSNEKKLVLTENLNSILEQKKLIKLLASENESRWLIVEEAWKNNISPNFLAFNQKTNEIESVSISERINLRSVVSVLLPYQHGNCFYCKKRINTDSKSEDSDFPDVDHFIPHSYFRLPDLCHISPDGIWNLVIACKECNRGSGGKSDKLPSKYFQGEILNRNLLFTEEHRHSLKNSILMSLNAKNHNEVQKKMISLFNRINLTEGWKPKLIYHYE